MSRDAIALLDDRGVVRVTGAAAGTFLDNLVTQDLEGMTAGDARFAALLSPQGKILFDFFVVRTQSGFLLDVAREKAADLAKRLTLYKLRAKVAVEDLSGVAKVWTDWTEAKGQAGCLVFADPRDTGLGHRTVWAPAAEGSPTYVIPAPAGAVGSAYDRRRIGLGIAEGGKDYPFGDTFPHEANMDRLNGVSFSKGCFVGQEVVARMQHKTVVRKRIVQVTAHAPLTGGAEIKAGEATIGTIGSVSGNEGLAMLRLDRAIEASDQGQPITSEGHALAVGAAALERYRTEAAQKAEQKAARI